MKANKFAELLESGGIALLIGQDLPSGITGLPSRRDLARDLSRRHNLPEQLTLPEVSERISRSGNRWEFTEFLRSSLDTSGQKPSVFYQRIGLAVKQHGIRAVITTCYDNSLELAFRQAEVPYNLVMTEHDVRFAHPARTTLLKFYGDTQRPDSLVVTERDHSALLREFAKKALIDEFRQIFLKQSVLIIGYDLSDPDFRFLFDEIAASRFARTAYAVWPGLSATDVQMWNDRGIIVLDNDPLGVVDNAPISSSLHIGKKTDSGQTTRKDRDSSATKSDEPSGAAICSTTSALEAQTATDLHLAEISLHQHYSGLFGAKVFWLAVLTLLPILISMRLPRLGIHLCPAAVVYIIYHGLGIYVWAKVRQLGMLKDVPTLKSETVRYCTKFDRVISVLSWFVIALLVVTFLCKLQIEFRGTHVVPFPNWVKEFVGVKGEAP